MTDLQIQLDDLKGVYSPGQWVTGKVILQAKEPIKTRFLKVCIGGGACVCIKTPNMTYQSAVNYLEGESLAWVSQDGSNKIPAGTNLFPFSFEIPPNCPPSYEGGFACVRYVVRVELDRAWDFNKRSRRFFTIIPTFDLSKIPTAIAPMENSVSKKINGIFSKKGEISMTAKIPKSGFVPGELIPITLQIDNKSKSPIVKLRAKIHQFSHIYTDKGAPGVPRTGVQKHIEQHLAESMKVINIAPGVKEQVFISIAVPPISPSFECPIISVNHSVSVKIDNGSELKCDFPIVIGTVPLITVPESDSPPAYGAVPPIPIVLAPSYELYVGGPAQFLGDVELFAPFYPVFHGLEQFTQNAMEQETSTVERL